jgi:hypothetical protein
MKTLSLNTNLFSTLIVDSISALLSLMEFPLSMRPSASLSAALESSGRHGYAAFVLFYFIFPFGFFADCQARFNI